MSELKIKCSHCKRELEEDDILVSKVDGVYKANCLYCGNEIVNPTPQLVEAINIIRNKVFLLKNRNLICTDTYLNEEEYLVLKKVLEIFKPKEREE